MNSTFTPKIWSGSHQKQFLLLEEQDRTGTHQLLQHDFPGFLRGFQNWAASGELFKLV